MAVEHVDAVVIGASMRGVIATYVLSTLGYRVVLLERGSDVGMGDGSFQLVDGTWFDYGMHVLDEDRSVLATRLLTGAVDQDVHRVPLRRGIVLRNHIMPYAPLSREMPESIRALLRGADLLDDIGDALPTRARIAACYGPAFAELIFGEVLPSYRCEHRHLAFGVDEAELMRNIYPWFFPRARRAERHGDESRAFHDRLRGGIEQYILYPRRGGFAEFGRGLLRKCDPARVQVLTGVRDLAVQVAPGTHRIDQVQADGRRFEAPDYFWTSGWSELCRLLSIACQDSATDRIVLGSFRLNRPPHTAFNEILVGDPAHEIDRIHFPGTYRESTDALVQIEFAFPRAEERSLDGGHWLERWTASLRALGILDREHRVELYDFKTRTLHFNSYGMDGERLRDADPAQIDRGSNIHPVAPSMANLNLNSHVPMDVAYVADVVTRRPAAGSTGQAAPSGEGPR